MGRIYLALYRGDAERELLERHTTPLSGRLIAIERSQAPFSTEVARLVASLDDDTVELAPLRVAWLPRKGEGNGWRALLGLGDPREPPESVKRREKDAADPRWRIVTAQPAALGMLRARWKQRTGGRGTDFADFVARQAELSLERAEYPLYGARYKMPRVEPADIIAAPGFTAGLARLAAETGRPEPDLLSEARGYLEELRTGHNPFAIEGMLRFFRAAYEKAYGTVDVVPDELAKLHDVFARYPALILPAHKANVDAPVVNTVLADHGLPLPSLFAGINMSFWPMGPIMRRAGYIFLRRDIRENATYRFVLREYLAYLIERRFNLSWFPEGTRSRTGKLLPPKLGLLTYVVDAYRQGRIEDIMLVPVALVYDQVYETKDFAREAKGAKKKPENLGWMLRYLRSLRTPYGKAYLRVAEPLSMREALGAPDPHADYKAPEAQLALQKLSLAVSWRINQATPITGIALVTFALLATGGRSIPRERLVGFVSMLVDHARKRGQPLADSAELRDPERLDAVLDTLMASGIVTRYDGGPTPVYGIAEGQHIGAAFYRNSMLHFVLERAIAEVAAVGAAAVPPAKRETQFIETALALRESLKFEFFFRERPAFEDGLVAEMDLIAPDWRKKLAEAQSGRDVLDSVFGVGLAHAALRPFLEAYRIVLDVLLTMPVDLAAQEKDVLAAADGLGRQYLLEQTIRNPEAVSRQLFGTAWQLACNVRLVEPGPDLAARRKARSRILRATLAALDAIELQCREALGG
ncbi:MAG: glycerol-3-phosphate 1-O-acyltransferase [Novosphingobium sp.]